MSKEEEIGFHKGAIATLLKERQELVRLVAIVDQLINGHVKALEKLGVKITQEKKEEKQENNLEDLLRQ